MKWKKNQTKISLSGADLEVMGQCNMSINEILRRDRPNNKIPPLWSVLSYVMLQHGSTTSGVWFHYRQLLKTAANTTRWYYRCHIPKSNGGTRELFIPNFFMQKQQRFIFEQILSGLPVDCHAYAYRKGVSIEDCAKPHVGKGLLIHLDLKNFFGSITEDMVFDTFLRETGYAPSLCRFLAQMCCLHGSLPQGTVTSPILSNIVFRRCDEALTNLADKHHLEYSRYSDDLFFSGSKDTAIRVVLREISGVLLSFGFKLNADKTQVRKQQHRQAVLGLTVNDHLQANRSYRRKLIQELYYLERFGKKCTGAQEAGDYLKYMQQLNGKLSYVLHIDPHNSRLWNAHLKLTIRMSRYAFLRERGFVT